MDIKARYACCKCGLSIPDGAGSVFVNYPDLLLARKPELNQEAEWSAVHTSCVKDTDPDCYWFGVERAQTVHHLFDWTIHFSETKDFLDTTNWIPFVESLNVIQRGV